jgi:hypothetical protein
VVPTIEVCDKRYVFNADAGGKSFNAAGACPTYVVPEWIATAVAAKQASDNEKIASLSGKMERDATQLANQKQKVADQLAAEQTEAAEDAAKTPLLGRVFGGKGNKNEPEPLPETASALTEPEPLPPPAPAPKAAAAAPAPAPATAEPAAPVVDQTTTATTAAAQEPVRRLSSDFDWPEDDVVAGGGKFLPSGLDIPPPTAN